jgi:hypothetical protein
MEYTNKVKVVTVVMGDGSERTDEFDGIGYIRISDGHLSLLKAAQPDTTIAAYAPGEWKRVKRQTKSD